jgi:hypothetical protein
MASKFARDGGIAFRGRRVFLVLAADARARFSNFAQDKSSWVPTVLLPASSRRRRAGADPVIFEKNHP